MALMDKTYAVVVAIATYPNLGWSKISGAVEQAAAFATWLVKDRKLPPDNIKVFCDSEGFQAFTNLGIPQQQCNQPFAEGIEDFFTQISTDWSQGEVLFIYWIGHGFVNRTGNLGERRRRLIFGDAKPKRKKNLDLNQLIGLLRSGLAGKFRHQIAFFDACAQPFDELDSATTLPEGGLSQGQKEIQNLSQYFYFAAASGQKAKNTVFGPQVLELIKGWPDTTWPPDKQTLHTLRIDIEARFRLGGQQPASLEYCTDPGIWTSLLSESSSFPIGLPDTPGEFFGREAELNLLTDSLADPQIAIVQFIAAGGTGKTKLLQRWLDQQNKCPSLRIAWSFYAQGSDEDKEVTATPFFERLFDEFHAEQRQFRSEDEKGEYLAGLLMRQPIVLILDGLEPLQHGGFGMQGELKDRALRVLLKNLAGRPREACLCVITSRLTVANLAGRATVTTHDLHNLELADGVALLQSLQVLGPQAELEQAVRDYGHHALALSLLGHAVNYWLEGDVRRRDTITELLDGDDTQSRRAFKVMQAYAAWLGPVELTLLQMLGLFDHPVEKPVLRLLREQQIPGLTEGYAERDFNQALQSLKQDHHLLFAPPGQPDSVDCHPLLREYFGKRLQESPIVWQSAQQRLYEYYKALPKKYQPDTLAEMQPLFAAISHGCAAGLHQLALDDVYYPRVLREGESYLVKKLGAFSDALAALAHFFTEPWLEPAVGLSEEAKAIVLSWAGFSLYILGRFAEAAPPMKASLKMHEQQGVLKEAALSASILSKLSENLRNESENLSNLPQACEYGRLAVKYADQSRDYLNCICFRTDLAETLLYSGALQEEAEALVLFQKAELFQQKIQPAFPLLYSVQGFQYCNLLLARGEAKKVLAHAGKTLAWAREKPAEGIKDMEGVSLYDPALSELSLALAHAQLALQMPAGKPSPAFDAARHHSQQAREFFDSAVAGLRAAGTQHYLPLALLARAAWFRATQDYPLAHKDLDEAKELAEFGPMRLHLCDYHLESARLALAEQDALTLSQEKRAFLDMARQHTKEAAELIAQTGYQRRLGELSALQENLLLPA